MHCLHRTITDLLAVVSYAHDVDPSGRKRRDPGWDALAAAVSALMETNDGKAAGLPATPKALADAMNGLLGDVDSATYDEHVVEAVDVRNWLNRRTNPRLERIPTLGEALEAGRSGAGGWDPLFLPRAMGVIPASSENLAIELALAVHRLQVRYNRLQNDTAARGQAHGAAAIVQRACESGDWAVAVWPAIEGPPNCRMHVADRLDFRRTSGALFTRDDLWNDFETVLRGAGAIPATSHPRWTQATDDDVSSDGSARRISHWAVPRVGAPRASTTSQPWPGVSSITVVAVTVQSWANDVASHLADALGYGLSSTRDMSMDLFGIRDGVNADEARRQLQQWLVEGPPRKRVWSHWSRTDPILAGTERIPQDLRVLWLHESDELLAIELERSLYRQAGNQLRLADLQAARDEGDRTVESLGTSAVRVDIDLPGGFRLTPTDGQREVRWQATLESALCAVEALVREGVLTQQSLRAFWSRGTKTSQPAHAPIVQSWIGAQLASAPLGQSSSS